MLFPAGKWGISKGLLEQEQSTDFGKYQNSGELNGWARGSKVVSFRSPYISKYHYLGVFFLLC
jgi:hypothetical protein